MAAKFKVGDMVRIVKRYDANGIGWADAMDEFVDDLIEDEVAVVYEIGEMTGECPCYLLKGNDYTWPEFSLEPAIPVVQCTLPFVAQGENGKFIAKLERFGWSIYRDERTLPDCTHIRTRAEAVHEARLRSGILALRT